MPVVKLDDADIDHQAWMFHQVEEFARDYRGTGKSSASDNTHWAVANQLARAIPNAKLVVLAGEGHHYLATNPVAAHKAIREFIK